MWWLLWTACAGSGSDSGSDNREAQVPAIAGTMRIVDLELVGDVNIQNGYAWAQGGTMVVYLANDPDATCEQIAAYLTASELVDPNPFLVGGACDVYLRVFPWEGSISVSDDQILAANSSINCAFGEGAFTLQGEGDNERYAWTGTWWQGAPKAYNLMIDAAGDDFDVTLEMFDYSGRLTLEGGEVYPAIGDVTGSVTVNACPALAGAIGR
ncbi:MAG: hypothetical protein AAFV53_20335 [Myxococcota bacterium]